MENYGQIQKKSVYKIHETYFGENYLYSDLGLLGCDLKHFDQEMYDKFFNESSISKIKFLVIFTKGFITIDYKNTVKQWDREQLKIIKDYNFVTENNLEVDISSVEITKKHEYFFIGDTSGCLKQYSIINKEIVKDFGKIHKRAIKVIYSTSDSQTLISSDLKGNINVFNLELERVAKYFPRAHDCAITSIVATPDSHLYISSDLKGTIKFWSLAKPENESTSKIIFSTKQSKSSGHESPVYTFSKHSNDF